MEILDIKIENIGTETYKKLYFVKDENNSSKDIYFYGNSSNLTKHKLSLNGDFVPNDKENQNHTINLQIQYPKSGQIYTLCIYVEDDNGNSLSKALKINVKIKKEEEPQDNPEKIIKEKAKILLPELENKYNFSIILMEEQVLQKLIELNNSEELIGGWIKDEFGKKSKELFKEFKMENICDENEGKEKIEELKFDKEKIKEWIKEKEIEIEKLKIENLYNELNAEFDIGDKIDKNEVLNKIKEKNFDKESIKEWLKSKLNSGGDIDKKRVDELVELFDSEYNILNILEEDEFRQKIVELNYDEKVIRDWIEEKLSS